MQKRKRKETNLMFHLVVYSYLNSKNNKNNTSTQTIGAQNKNKAVNLKANRQIKCKLLDKD